MNCVSCDIYMRVPPWVVSVFPAGVFLSSRVTGTCPVTPDLIMRVNVRTTTTTENLSDLTPICGNSSEIRT